MNRPAFLLNGVPVEPLPRQRPELAPEPDKPRIFDHFKGGEPEDSRFSKVAREMRRGYLRPATWDSKWNHILPCDQGPTAWWQTVPDREDLTEVSGEIVSAGDLSTTRD